MASNSTQTRVRPGVPAGGQWAAVQRDEPGQLDLDGVANRILDQARKSAAWHAARTGRDAEEIAGETVLRVVTALRKNPSGLDQVNLNGYVHQVARSVATRITDQGAAVSSADVKAWKVLQQRRSERATELGHDLTPAELVTLADEIRMSFPPGRRPTPHFYEVSIVKALDVNQYDRDDEDPLHPRTVGMPETPNSYVETVEQVLDKHGARRARQHAWNLVASGADAPTVSPGTLSERNAAQARRTMASYPGGVGGAVRAYLGGTLDETTQRALFAAFGDPNASDRDEIAETLSRHRNLDTELWESGITMATAPRRGMTA